MEAQALHGPHVRSSLHFPKQHNWALILLLLRICDACATCVLSTVELFCHCIFIIVYVLFIFLHLVLSRRIRGVHVVPPLLLFLQQPFDVSEAESDWLKASQEALWPSKDLNSDLPGLRPTLEPLHHLGSP